MVCKQRVNYLFTFLSNHLRWKQSKKISSVSVAGNSWNTQHQPYSLLVWSLSCQERNMNQIGNQANRENRQPVLTTNDNIRILGEIATDKILVIWASWWESKCVYKYIQSVNTNIQTGWYGIWKFLVSVSVSVGGVLDGYLIAAANFNQEWFQARHLQMWQKKNTNRQKGGWMEI